MPEDLHGHLDGFMRARNSRPIAEFQGLSPNEMHQLLYEPFDAPELVTLPDVLESDPSSQISDLFIFLAEELARGPIRLTAKGSLPRAFSREAAERYETVGEAQGPYYLGPRNVQKEADFKALEVMRIVAQVGGLIRKYRGQLLLTRNGSRLMEDQGARGIYPVLLRAYVERFNWGYTDRYEDLWIIQRSWAFTAYLLTRYGAEARRADFYSDLFIEAFPASLVEVADHQFWEPADVVGRCYRIRALERFAEYFGLARIEYDGATRVLADLRITSLPLLTDAVRFRSARRRNT